MNDLKSRSSLLLLLALLWVLFVLGGYYYFHKPISIEAIAAPLISLIDVVLVVLAATLAGAVGHKLLRAEEQDSLQAAALQFALGVGIMSIILLLVIAAGWLNNFGLPLFLAGLILLRKNGIAWLRHFGALSQIWQHSGKLEKVLAILAGTLAAYQFFIALAPPVKWDALAYHLQLPRQYLAAGRLIFTPENPYWGHPQLVEMLYTFMMWLRGEETAALFNWAAGCICLAGIFGLTNQLLARFQTNTVSTTAGWTAVIAVLSGNTFRYLLGWSYTDLFSALFGLAALASFFAWLDSRRGKWLLWAGLFCGFALGTKWTSGVLLLGLLAAAVIFRKQTGLTFRLWFSMGLASALAALPWLVKNWLVTGSPVYPYIIGTPWFDAARLASANAPETTIDWWQHLLLPLSTTWAGVDSAAGFATDLGPLLLLFCVPGLWLYRKEKQTKTVIILLLVVSLGLGVASLRFGHLKQTRLYFAALPAVAVFCGLGWERLQQQVLTGVRLRRILSAVLLLVLGLVFWQDTIQFASSGAGRVSLGVASRQEYLETNTGYYIRAVQQLTLLSSQSKILMLWEPRGLYAPLNAQADLWIDRWRTDFREHRTAQAILSTWKSQGFTHLLVYQMGIDLIRPEEGQQPSQEWIELQELFASLPEPQSFGDIYLLYELY